MTEETLCMARTTNEKIALRFGDNRHNFHVELRCNKPVIPGNNVCGICIYRSSTFHTHGSRRFDHGLVNEPIPDHSHIFGGKWYNRRIADYGMPSEASIKKAFLYQEEARGNYVVNQPSYKDDALYSNKEEMPPKKDGISSEKKDGIKKRGRKPKVVITEELIDDKNVITSSIVDHSEEVNISSALVIKEAKEAKEKKTRKKVENTQEIKKRSRKSKKSITPDMKETTFQEINEREVCVASHIEESTEQFDIDGMEILYIKLTNINIDDKEYYIDNNKSKLYENLNNKIGDYIGRYDKKNNNIVFDVPDSDDDCTF